MTSDHRLSEAYEDMTEIAALNRRIAELEAALDECMANMDHAKVFISTREKMHPQGQEFFDDARAKAANLLKGGKDE